ncbi:MAG: NAD(+) synthase, partial [Chloroflexi bacterium]|nr:NAD(+) synthase [Chloroflexota bacterium]
IMPCHSQADDEALARQVAEAFGLEMLKVDLRQPFEALLAQLPSGERLAQANIKSRLRMVTLYYLANQRNYMVLGTGNKTELMVGYFTKYGDGAADLTPIAGLYKHQVWALARAIGVPEAIVKRKPSGGLWPGQTDEDDMGISYSDLDAILQALELGDASACDPQLVQRVQGMVARSEHKRRLPPIGPAAD